jgi:hypothetical protein
MCSQIGRAEHVSRQSDARLLTYRTVVPRKASPLLGPHGSGESLPGNGQVVDPAMAIRPGPEPSASKEKR